MFFVVGLGNPGCEYEGTRHNVGFEVVDRLAQRHTFPAFRTYNKASISRGAIRKQDVLLMKPQTYMNLSGDAVQANLHTFQGAVGDLVVIYDEMDFEPGTVKLKRGGGHAGHKGLRSIMSHLGRDFCRVRVGIGKGKAGAGVDHVLSTFDPQTRPHIEDAIERAADAVQFLIQDGLSKAMNRINAQNGGTTKERQL